MRKALAARRTSVTENVTTTSSTPLPSWSAMAEDRLMWKSGAVGGDGSCVAGSIAIAVSVPRSRLAIEYSVLAGSTSALNAVVVRVTTTRRARFSR
jgi:hypothetical protein